MVGACQDDTDSCVIHIGFQEFKKALSNHVAFVRPHRFFFEQKLCSPQKKVFFLQRQVVAKKKTSIWTAKMLSHSQRHLELLVLFCRLPFRNSD